MARDHSTASVFGQLPIPGVVSLGAEKLAVRAAVIVGEEDDRAAEEHGRREGEAQAAKLLRLARAGMRSDDGGSAGGESLSSDDD